ncbi:MAG: hypothetical protein OTJ97_11480, partial [SAR202 cluster bacterium]|nr:hypothetical protein [SAR202 cluster bacterium]
LWPRGLGIWFLGFVPRPRGRTAIDNKPEVPEPPNGGLVAFDRGDMEANGTTTQAPAALYLRKSNLDDQAGDNRSIADQRHDPLHLAERDARHNPRLDAYDHWEASKSVCSGRTIDV